MNPKAHEREKDSKFDSRHQQPIFRHPYEKYISRISNDSFNRISCGNRDLVVNPGGSKVEKRREGQKGFQDKNIYICQTFLKENPFFGAYYPTERPSSATNETPSAGVSERSRSVGTDFDDSRTYRIIRRDELNWSEDRSSATKSKFKKSDDIRHFHEHHHFFHDKTEEKLGSGHRGKSKETPKNRLESNLSFLKEPIEESCFVYQKEDGVEGQKMRDDSKEISRSSSKTGRKSSDNETYTVVCEYCQKLLRDYPDARVVGHENVPVRLSNEFGDKRPYIQYSYNGESMGKMNWITANAFVQDAAQGRTSRKRESNRVANVGNQGEKKFYRSSREEDETRRRIRIHENSNYKLILFKCDHCKSIIQLPYVFKVMESNCSSSSCSSEEVLKSVTAKPSVNEKSFAKSSGVTSAVTKKSNTTGNRNVSLTERASESSISSKTRKSFIPKTSVTIQKVKSFGQKSSMKGGSAEKATVRMATISDERNLKEEIPEGKKRGFSYNESALMDKKPSSVKEKRASGKMSKRVLTTKGSIEVCLESKENPAHEEMKSSRKTSSSDYKLPKEFSDMNKKRSLCCKESKIHLNRNMDENESDAVKEFRKRTSSYNDSAKSASKKNSTSRKESGVSSRKAIGTDVYVVKVESKQKVLVTKERSMQTESEKFAAADDSKLTKRSGTASKAVDGTGVSDGKRSVTAPVSLTNSRSTNTHKESTLSRGGSAVSKRTAASKEVPIITTDHLEKSNSGFSGIQDEIYDLKTQLCRLEAMHNLKSGVTTAENHDGTDCQKHPIVVCTSTTFIMTNYGIESDEMYPKETSKRREVPNRKKDSAAEFGLHVESTPPRPRHEYVGQMRVLRRENPEDKQIPKEKHRDCLGKATAANYQVFGEKIAKAVNRVCRGSNRALLSRFNEGTKSCNKEEEYHRFFGNGKNQKRMWTENGASTDKCCMKFDGNMKTHCRWHLVNFDRESVLKAIASTRGNLSDDVFQRLFAYRSCSAVIGQEELKISREKFGSDVNNEEIFVGRTRIEGEHGKGYFLRTSVSDICEYRNGSLIRLTDNSGWMVLTKKLFIQRVDSTKKREDFAVYSAMTPNSEDTRSAIVAQPTGNDRIEPEEIYDFLANHEPNRESPRHALSESSIYLPLSLRDSNAGRMDFANKNEVSRTSVHLPRNVRHRNRGCVNLQQRLNQRESQLSNELFLLNCRSAADWSTICGIRSEGAKCTWTEQKSGRRRNWGEGDNTWKMRNETVPVLFEEMKTSRGVKAKRQSSDVSLKCVFAETICDKRTGSKVFWSSDWCNSKNKNKYVFAVSRTGRNVARQKPFSMSDMNENQKQNQSATSEMMRESSGELGNRRENTRKLRNNKAETMKQEEIAPQGDSPVTPVNRCACCNCSPQHICSGPNEKREEISGFRRLLKDIGLADINLNFLRRFHCDPPVRQRPTRSKFSPKKIKDDLDEESSYNSSRSAKAPEKEAVNFRGSITVEQMEDQDLQRVRITEWENKLRNFEMKLEDMKRQNEAFACKCEEPPRMLQENRLELESPKFEVQDLVIEKEEVVKEEKTKDRDLHVEHSYSCLPSRIEIISEKKVCTCQNCSDIHYIVKQYIPTDWMKNCKDVSPPQPKEIVKMIEKKPEFWENSEKAGSVPMTGGESDEEKFLKESDLEKSEGGRSSWTETYEKSEAERFSWSSKTDNSKKQLECDKNGAISCECTTKGDKSNGKKCCNCDSKLKLIENRLKALEIKKRTSKSSSGKEESTVEEEKSAEEKPVSEGEEDESSYENIESETDNEVKTKIVSCNSLDFFVGGDPEIPTKCECRENSSCAFKHISDRKKTEKKNVFFVTNIEHFRDWSRFNRFNYKYCDSFRKCKKPAVKTLKIHRDWGNVKSAVTSFFRSKIRRRRIFGRMKGKMRRESSGISDIESSASSSSFIDDCSRSSMPLKRRSYHILSVGPSPMKPKLAQENEKRKKRKRPDGEDEES